MIHVASSQAADEANAATLPQLWRRRCAQWGNRPALRHKQCGIWQGPRWSDYFAEARAIGLAMDGAGLAPGDVVSILSDNCPQWLTVDVAAQAMGYVSHGIYPCSTAPQVGHALAEAGSRVVIVENTDQLMKVLAVRDQCPDLRHIVVMETRGLRRFTDAQVSSYDEWRARGAEAATKRPGLFDSRIDAGSGNQIAFLASTAGSTGAARLVAVRQHEFMQEVRATRQWLRLHPGDRSLSVVSLAQHGERLLAAKAMLVHESLLHFPENPATVFNDMLEVEPHFLFAPPRFFEKLQGLTELFMQEAIPVARAAYAASLSSARPSSWWQRKTRGRIRAALGLRNVRLVLTSGASSPGYMTEWFETIGVPVHDCYGLAEVGFCTDAQLKLAPDGEILVHSANPLPGYWKRGEMSHTPTDLDGWLRTGDLGRLDEQGRVRLVGRIQARAVCGEGTPISPEVAEDAFRQSAYIADAVVVRKDERITALLSLDEERIRNYAQQHKLPFTDYTSLLALPEIDALVAAQVQIANGRLPERHRVRNVRVIPRPLRSGDEELTPALRLNRWVVVRRYADLLDAV